MSSEKASMSEPSAFMVRQAIDGFGALAIGHAMQSLPTVDVVSVVFKDDDRGGKWHVFATYSPEVIGIAEIDKKVDAALSQ